MKSALKARSICVVPVITVIIVIRAHKNVNRGWLDRIFLNCGWLGPRSDEPVGRSRDEVKDLTVSGDEKIFLKTPIAC